MLANILSYLSVCVCVCSAVAVLTSSLLITLVNPATADCIGETKIDRVIYAYV
jgi:hypothetical protein